ncbi:Retrovirus-related Pol polyprotein from transposon TNT 1-94 [Includes: Protease [Durusdinium trenchii]|uniref:Retrovirus-related Pol polyprotein from transposon TNT 1-94 n=1 Tax=Durusdinium trenchii TaxID=1381693 RepID=A0ABP0MEB1_9DINO
MATVGGMSAQELIDVVRQLRQEVTQGQQREARLQGQVEMLVHAHQMRGNDPGGYFEGMRHVPKDAEKTTSLVDSHGLARPDGTRHQLDEEIRMPVPEHMRPGELEKRSQLNRSRFTPYLDVRDKIVLNLEARLGAKVRMNDASQPPGGQDPQSMDAGAFKEKGKGRSKKGKGKGKECETDKGDLKNNGKWQNSGRGQGSQIAGALTAVQRMRPGSRKEPPAELHAKPMDVSCLDLSGLEVEIEIDPEIKQEMEDADRCMQPCDYCFCQNCGLDEGGHVEHICNLCDMDWERFLENEDLKSIRAALKMTKPDDFEYIVDKTICLMKGISLKTFQAYKDDVKEKLRKKVDPDESLRKMNKETLQQVEKHRQELRLLYFEKLTDAIVGESRTSGSGQPPGSKDGETSQTLGQAGSSSGTVLHRTIEQMEVANIDAAIREKMAACEECETKEEVQKLETEVMVLKTKKDKLKEKIQRDDQVTKAKAKAAPKLTAENLNDQSWHDSRYYQAVKAGASHSLAWSQERKRRKATLHRQQGVADRAAERIRMDKEWHEEFDSKPVKEEEFDKEEDNTIETEAVQEMDDGTVRVFRGQAKRVGRGKLKKHQFSRFFKSARTYRKLSQEEVAKFAVETKDDELRVMGRKRTDVLRRRDRPMSKEKKESRKKRVRKARARKRKEEEEKFYLKHPHDKMRCFDFRRSHCGKGVKCKMAHSEIDRERYFMQNRHDEVQKDLDKVKLTRAEINSFAVNELSVDKSGWVKVTANLDTGAAVTAIPTELKGLLGMESEDPNGANYKTASGELIADEGGGTIRGLTEEGYGRKVDGRFANVHRLLVSGSKVTARNLVVMDGEQGDMVPKNGPIAHGLRKALKDLKRKFPKDTQNVTKMYAHKGIFCFDLWCKAKQEARGDKAMEELAAVEEHPEGRIDPMDRRIILKSDNEVSIKALKDSIKAAAKTELSLEEGKTGDKPSTGSVESAVRETKRQCRAMKSALEEKMGKSIPDRHAIWTWLARHACFLISRYRVGPDGRTPYERLKGKRWRRPLVVFGERVHFRPLQSYVSGRSDLAPKLDMGVYVGTHGRNGDALVMTKEGVIKGGSLKRLTVEERWADVELFKGTPWKMRPKSEEDVEAAAVRIELPAAEGRLMPEPVARDSGPRNLYVTRRDVEGNYTAGCPGCIAIQVGLPARAHSVECRTLVQNRLMATEEGKERVLKAQKRKEGGAAPKVALADVPDEAEEMHASDAVGRPEERVDPVGQPVPGSGTGRIDPIGRSTPPVSRAAEGATGDESPTKKGRYATVKKAKVESARGLKRGGGDLDDLYGSETPREGEVELERGPSSSSKGEAAVATPAKEQEEKVDKSPMPAPVRQLVIETICNLELASFLNEKMFPEASFEECKNVSREMLHLGASRTHVAEIYNPERFTSRANQFGLSPGFAIDMELQKPNGEYWDLSKKADEEEMNRLLDRHEPTCLIGSPPCGSFSPLQNLSKSKRTPEENERIRQEGLTHLRVACKSYLKQMNEGRIFLHEHPKGASSWKEPEVQMLINDPRVILVEGPMCRWGMKATDQQGEGFVRKETRYLTNSVAIAAALSGQCSGEHRHVHLVNGRARQAQKYPPRMVAAILRAIRQELRWRGELNELSVEGSGPSPDGETNEPNNKFDAPVEDHEQAEYFDTVTGAPLRKEAVLAARQEELRWVQKQQIYVKVPIEECHQATGKPPITLKWVDKNKGDNEKENYRSRLVVREVKKPGQTVPECESFSAMPPLEALKALCSLMTSMKVSRRGKVLKLKLLDISRAHFYGDSQRAVYCTLPEGDETPGHCARLVKTMYGTQDAASIWQATYSELLQEHGIQAGTAWPSIFYDTQSDARFLVHGDDFLILGDEDAQERIATILAKKFEFRVDGCVGPEESDGTVMSVLNRILEYNKSTGTLTYEADPRHAEIIVKQLQLEGAREVSTPSVKQTGEEAFVETPPLNHEQAKTYRSLVMRAAYLSLDRGDLCEAVKTLARSMSVPDEDSWARLKRLGRYLLGKPRVVQEFKPQRMYTKIRAFTDSDHAGHVQTRYLWVQQKLKEKEFELVAVGTDKNVADLCTKPLSAETCWKHMHALGQFAKTGKSAAAKAIE